MEGEEDMRQGRKHFTTLGERRPLKVFLLGLCAFLLFICSVGALGTLLVGGAGEIWALRQAKAAAHEHCMFRMAEKQDMDKWRAEAHCDVEAAKRVANTRP